jgi:hypothetical protein
MPARQYVRVASLFRQIRRETGLEYLLAPGEFGGATRTSCAFLVDVEVPHQVELMYLDCFQGSQALAVYLIRARQLRALLGLDDNRTLQVGGTWIGPQEGRPLLQRLGRKNERIEALEIPELREVQPYR